MPGIQLGELEPNALRLITPGDIERILSEEAFIHTVMHMGHPSLTLVIRNKGGLVQYDYSMNGLGVNAYQDSQTHVRQVEVLSAYQSLRDAGPLPVRSHLVLSPRWHGATAETVQACLSDWLGWLKRRGLGDDTLRVQGIYAEPGITEENSLRAEAG